MLFSVSPATAGVLRRLAHIFGVLAATSAITVIASAACLSRKEDLSTDGGFIAACCLVGALFFMWLLLVYLFEQEFKTLKTWERLREGAEPFPCDPRRCLELQGWALADLAVAEDALKLAEEKCERIAIDVEFFNKGHIHDYFLKEEFDIALWRKTQALRQAKEKVAKLRTAKEDRDNHYHFAWPRGADILGRGRWGEGMALPDPDPADLVPSNSPQGTLV